MDEDRKQQLAPVWIKNGHGVKSCWPRELAERLVRKNYGWEFAAPDAVPKRKQYPLGSGELRESGLKRRTAAQQSTKYAEDRTAEVKQAETENLSLGDLRTRAERLGIDRYWCKSETRLKREISEVEA